MSHECDDAYAEEDVQIGIEIFVNNALVVRKRKLRGISGEMDRVLHWRYTVRGGLDLQRRNMSTDC